MIPKTLKRLAAGTACLVGLAPLGLAQWTTETVPNPRTAIAMTATDNGKVLIAGGSPGGGVFARSATNLFSITAAWKSGTSHPRVIVSR